MKLKFFRIFTSFISLGVSASCFAGQFTSHVDTRIGTAANVTAKKGASGEKAGNVQPSSALPFGMVQWGPDTDHADAGSYHADDTHIKGFSLTHLSGAGCANSQELSVMPLTEDTANTHASFKHANEVAAPGFYSVQLDDGILVELSSTLCTGLGRFTFPSSTTPRFELDFTKTGSGNHLGDFQQDDDTHFRGWVQGGNFCNTKNKYKVYFSIVTDQKVKSFSISKNGNAILSFDPSNGQTRELKIGLSYVSVQNALSNLSEENQAWDFDSVKMAADQAWDQKLGSIQVSQESPLAQKMFYTALYHSFLHPNIFSDSDGSYLGFDQKIHNVSERPGQLAQYANFSGWDIYRTEIQLLAFLLPEITGDMVQSLVNDGNQCGGLPKWANNNDDTGVMVGDPGPLIVSNAYAFGAHGFDTAAALALMKNSGSVPGIHCNQHEIRPNLDLYLQYGFIPREKSLFDFTYDSASTTLEYASSDFAISQFAKSLGDLQTSQAFLKQSNAWKNLVDPTSGYIRPRYKSGRWLFFFGLGSTKDFAEGNSAQYSWMVPFDVPSIFSNMGGVEVAKARLDDLFQELNAYKKSPHLWIGNEPDLGLPWTYHWLGRPDLSQKTISRILSENFDEGFGGLPGNDDLGATSAFYVWSSLGLYPSIPGIGGFAIGKPHFSKIEIHLAQENPLVLQSTGIFSDDSVIQSLTVSGSSWTRSWIALDELKNSGNIQFHLAPSDANNTSWAIEPSDLPPSVETLGK